MGEEAEPLPGLGYCTDLHCSLPLGGSGVTALASPGRRRWPDPGEGVYLYRKQRLKLGLECVVEGPNLCTCGDPQGAGASQIPGKGYIYIGNRN